MPQVRVKKRGENKKIEIILASVAKWQIIGITLQYENNKKVHTDSANTVRISDLLLGLMETKTNMASGFTYPKDISQSYIVEMQLSPNNIIDYIEPCCGDCEYEEVDGELS